MKKDKKKDAPKKDKKSNKVKRKDGKVVVIERVVKKEGVDISPETGLETDGYAGVM